MNINLAPGDRCHLETQCYGNGTCVDGICMAADPNVGADCDDIVIDGAYIHGGDLMCAPGQYCSEDPSDANENVCTAVLPAGSVCKSDNQCGYSAVCLFNTCVAWGTLPHGSEVEDLS